MKYLIILLPVTILLGSCSLLVDFKDDKSLTERNCNDGLDNDNDSFIDCQDQDCDTSPDCTVVNNVINGEICDNGSDDDDDGAIDCDDSDCANDPYCGGLREICNNDIDDDDDGLIDCKDPDCQGQIGCENIPGETDCGDGADRDGTAGSDGMIDCDDPDCALNPICVDGLIRCDNIVEHYNNFTFIYYFSDIYQSGESIACVNGGLCGVRPENSWVPYCYPEPADYSSSYQVCDMQRPCGPGLVCEWSDHISQPLSSNVCLPLCAPGYANFCISGIGVCYRHWTETYDAFYGQNVELWLCDRPPCDPMASVATSGCGGTTSTCIPATDLFGDAACHSTQGTTAVSAPCQSDNDCIPGAICRQGENDESTVCHRLCVESTTCGANTCFRADNRQRYGFCQ